MNQPNQLNQPNSYDMKYDMKCDMKYGRKLEWVGMVVPVITAFAYGFEIYQITHEKDAKELNWIFLIGFLLVGILWFIYGVVNKINVVIIQGIICTIPNIILIALKIHYDCKKNKEDE